MFVVVFLIVPLVLMLAYKYYLVPNKVVKPGGTLSLIFNYGLGFMVLVWGFVEFYRRYLA